MARRQLLIDSFAGGWHNRMPPEKIDDSECSYVQGFWMDRGTLKSFGGLTRLGTRVPHVRQWVGYPVYGLHRYYGADDNYTLMKSWEMVWIGIEASTTVAYAVAADEDVVPVVSTAGFPTTGQLRINDCELFTYTHKDATNFYGCGPHSGLEVGDTLEEVDWRPCIGTAYEGNSPYIGSVGVWNPTCMVTANNRVYTTSEYASKNFRWDGYEYHTGRVMCDGLGNVEMEHGSGIDWSTVLPGDTIYFAPVAMTTVSRADAVGALATDRVTSGTAGPRLYVTNGGNFQTYEGGGIAIVGGVAASYGWVDNDATYGPYLANCGPFPAVQVGDKVISREWFCGLGHREQQTIKRVYNDSGTWKLTLDGNSLNTTGKGITPSTGDATVYAACNYVDYIIVRSHWMGIPAAATTPTATLTATVAGYLEASKAYQWRWRYKNSQTGATGNISAASNIITTNASNKFATLTGWDTNPFDRQIDQVELFRTVGDDPVNYYLSQTLTRTWNGTNWAFAATCVDGDTAGESDANLGAILEVDASYHTRPLVGLGQLKEFNSHLWARQTKTTANVATTNVLRFSSVGDYEYWPDMDFSAEDVGATLSNIGGYFILGDNNAEPVMDFVGEGGVYISSGRQGANLLVWTKRRAFRLFGTDWSDFAVQEAFGTGAASCKSAVNFDGLIIWLAKQGVMALPQGSGQPKIISQKIVEYMPETFDTPLTYFMPLAFGIVWGEYYVLLWSGGHPAPVPGTVWNNQIIAYHPQTGIWTNFYDLPAGMFANVWDGGNDNYELCMSSSTTSACYLVECPVGDYTYTDPAAQAGVTAKWQSKVFSLAADKSELPKIKKLARVTVCSKRPAVDQTLTVKVYADNFAAGTTVESASITLDASATKQRVYNIIDLTSCYGRTFQIELSGVFTSQVEILWVMLDYDIEVENPRGVV